MVLEGLRGYLQIASGLTDVTRQRATGVAQSLLSQGAGLGSGLSSGLPSVGDLREQVAGVAEDLLATSKANREMLLGLVRGEVERQVTKLGLVSASELEAATKRAQRLEVRVHDLERRVAAQQGAASAPAASGPAATAPAPTKVPARKVATKAPATKVPAKKVPAKKVSATKAASDQVAAAPTPGERAAAKRAVAGARARKGTQA